MLRVEITAAMDPNLKRLRELAKDNDKGAVHVSGVSGTGTAVLAALISDERRHIVIMTASHERAKKLRDDLAFFVDETGRKICLLPDEDQLLLQYEAKSHAHLEQRINAVTALLSKEPTILIGTPESLLKKMVPSDYFVENILEFKSGEEIEQDRVKRGLSRMGYERSSLVEAKGQYSIRGGIIDIFPPDLLNPVRIELFDTQIDSIRTFDIQSQRSLSTCENALIYPAQLMVYDEVRFESAAKKIEKNYDKAARKLTEQAKRKIVARKERLLEFIDQGINLQLLECYLDYFYDETQTIFDYADNDSVLIIDDMDRIKSRIALYTEELRADYNAIIESGEAIAEDFDIEYTQDELQKKASSLPTFFLNPFAKTPEYDLRLKEALSISTKQVTSYFGKMDMLCEEIKRYKKNRYEVFISCSGEERERSLRDFLDRNGMTSLGVQLISGELSSGIEFIDEKLVIISDRDIFSSIKRKKSSSSRKDAKPIKSFTDIRQGDYIVHENHGIGKFIGIEQRNFEGVIKDYLKIKYAGEDFLYVPVGQMDFVQKYVGSEGAAPKVNKLTGAEWKRTKVKAQMAIAKMARELMEVSARRKMQTGHAFGEDTIWQKEFEELFSYVETNDQIRCIREIKQDMQNPVIMERLLCGDVGYGKTEVAARAAFKCAIEGKQVAILVPTTILANQHYHTFCERFEKFPMQIEMLCRFRNEKQQRQIIDKLKAGKIDIIIGTHRILSKDVEFNDLGLLIIDEEHRFGVSHKEVIKTLKNKVDVLTLSATPIPRTLHMSLSGIRDMSVIEEPPEERYPVQTYVMEQDDEILREIIRREIERDGQVFIVFNKVNGIKKTAAHIKTLVPEASIAVGHGQMNEKELENIMVDFMENRCNVLVATTIIESGIDISNANTMIILDADKFGLSQLYQLRGRVGRSNRMAYAYLFYQRSKVLTEIAQKRLRAIREFTEFGSGFKIAMRDLEIRGAGNLLGTEQSGHMMTIGYELYCKLLDDAVKALTGKGDLKEAGEKMPETLVELQADAYISNDYIPDEDIKLQMYKKISEIQTKEEEMEITDELIDRFGDLPQSTQNLVSIAMIKSMGQRLGVQRIIEKKNRICLEFYGENELKPALLAKVSREYGSNIVLRAGVRPAIELQSSSSRDKIRETRELLNKLLLEVAKI